RTSGRAPLPGGPGASSFGMAGPILTARSRPLDAGRAQAPQLDGQPVDREPRGGGALRQDGADLRAIDLRHRAAAGADQELAHMRLVGSRAADEGVERLDPVNEAVVAQEIERAIDGGRRGGAAVAAELLKDVVGADGRVAAPDELQNSSSQRR